MGCRQRDFVRRHSSGGVQAHAHDGAAGIARSPSFEAPLKCQVLRSTKTGLMYAAQCSDASSITPDAPLGTDPLYSVSARVEAFVYR